MRSRRTFTAEFKREAVRQLKLRDKTASEIARELAIPRAKLYSWRDELESNGDGAFPGKGSPGLSSKLAAEVARLKK